MAIRNLGAIINDTLRLRFVKEAFAKTGKRPRLLDLGCGVKPFLPVYSLYASESVGIDVAHSPHDVRVADILYDGEHIPFPDQEFDIVFCTEVMEHVPEPALFLKEIYRVLKPGGVVIMTTPFLVPLHEEPHDYYRYTKHGIHYLLNKTGFRSIEIEPFGEYFAVSIAFCVQIQLKFWNGVSKLLGLRIIYSEWNPFVFLFVVLPQWLYLALFRQKFMDGVRRRLSYTPRGYGYLAVK